MATITDNISRIKQAKADIKEAIIAKGVEVEDDVRIDGYAEKISEIQQGGDKGWNAIVEIIDTKKFGVINIRKITFEQGTIEITEAANGGTQLEEIVFNDDLEILGNNAFRGCTKLTSAVIPNSVTSILNSVFYNCANLENVGPMPPNLTTIVNGAFLNCGKIKLFDFRRANIVPTMPNINAFNGTKGVMVVPDTLYDEWVSATNWATYADRIIKASEYTES